MDNLKIEFMTMRGTFRMFFGPSSLESNKAYHEMLLCFANLVGGKFELPPFIKMSAHIKANIIAYVGGHGESKPNLYKLRKKIVDMPDGEFFLLMNEVPDETEELTKLEVLLEVLNECGEDDIVEEWERRLSDNNNFAGGVLTSYDIFTPRTDIRTTIGNAVKDDRVCRFCKGTLLSGAKFKKVAHSIPEALGNKTLILGDECDGCNEYFGTHVEPHFIGSLDIYRAILGVKGKSGVPNIKYSGGEISHRDGVPVISAKNITVLDDALVVDFGGVRRFVPAKMYRALCKMTLSAIEDRHIKGLEDTLHWVRNDQAEIPLPKLASRIVGVDAGEKSPFAITTFIRKTDNYSIPHVVSEFRFGSFVYIYILPLSRKDCLDFVREEDFNRFWTKFDIFSSLSDWEFSSYQSTQEFLINDTIRVSTKGLLHDYLKTEDDGAAPDDDNFIP